MPFQFISFQCSLRTPETYGERVDQNSMKKKMAERSLVTWDLFKVQRFLTYWGSECRRIAPDLLLSSGFRAAWRQCSLGAC